jgi:hypothetical protein
MGKAAVLAAFFFFSIQIAMVIISKPNDLCVEGTA